MEAVALIQLVRQPVKYPADHDAADKQGEKCMSLGSFLTIEIYGSLFLSPHSHMPSNMGMSDFPRSVRLYSTWSASNSFNVELSVLKEISPIYFFISLNRTMPNSISV